MGSKGQVTVFIILGILLLGIFGLFLYFTGTTIEQEVTSASRDIVEDVPSEFIAIQSYTESCIESTATEALIILGQQGGHLFPDLVGDYSLSDPTNSDGVTLDPLSIPYWHYNALENGQSAVSIASLQPTLDDEEDYYSIAAQLGRYIDENIEDCLIEYGPFVEQGYLPVQWIKNYTTGQKHYNQMIKAMRRQRLVIGDAEKVQNSGKRIFCIKMTEKLSSQLEDDKKVSPVSREVSGDLFEEEGF